MSRPLEIFLRSYLRDYVRVYVDTFSDVYLAVHGYLDGYDVALKEYEGVIREHMDAIFRASAAEIQRYINRYNVKISQSPDECKIIYYLGVVIDRYLERLGLDSERKVHLTIMVGLMDQILLAEKIDKVLLRRNLLRLIQEGKLWEELGHTGLYLIFKCVSTTPKHLIA